MKSLSIIRSSKVNGKCRAMENGAIIYKLLMITKSDTYILRLAGQYKHAKLKLLQGLLLVQLLLLEKFFLSKCIFHMT